MPRCHLSKTHELLPDAARVVEGLRDTGYQFNTAVADVVDNSIAADATSIHIILKQDFRGNASLRIVDNGTGMNDEELLNAMRYGSNVRTNKASLGKFGLGLKTASTAFCRRLVVISRNDGAAELSSATWDLDHVRDNNRWEILLDSPSKTDADLLVSLIGDGSGTLVVWDKMDRVMKTYKDLAGGAARRAFEKIVQSLRQHLSVVYQRFLDPADARARNIRILLNGEDVTCWDPFVASESIHEGEEEIDVQFPDESHASFRIRAFILPRKEEFTSEDAWKAARVSNQNQGIYIYRENRLIHGPDWLGLFTKEPHFSLLRVEFSFDHSLDEAFQIDIKKSQIILDEGLTQFVIDFLAPRRRAAEELYRRGTRAKVAKTAQNAHDVSNRNISSKESQVSTPDCCEPQFAGHFG
jgi:hypothetical protein